MDFTENKIFAPVMAIFYYPGEMEPFDFVIERSATDSTPLRFEFDLESWEVGQLLGGS